VQDRRNLSQYQTGKSQAPALSSTSLSYIRAKPRLLAVLWICCLLRHISFGCRGYSLSFATACCCCLLLLLLAPCTPACATASGPIDTPCRSYDGHGPVMLCPGCSCRKTKGLVSVLLAAAFKTCVAVRHTALSRHPREPSCCRCMLFMLCKEGTRRYTYFQT
jgi:hypothetical protein